MIQVCVFGSWVWKCKNIKWAAGELDIFTFSHERDKFTNKYHKTNLNSAFIPCFLLFKIIAPTTWYITQYHGVCITFHGTRYITKHGITYNIQYQGDPIAHYELWLQTNFDSNFLLQWSFPNTTGSVNVMNTLLRSKNQDRTIVHTLSYFH